MKKRMGKNNQNKIKEAQERVEKILTLFGEAKKHFQEALKLQIKKDPTIKEKIERINALVRTSEYKKDIKELESFERDENTGDLKDEKGYWKKYYEITDKYNIYSVVSTNLDGSPDLSFCNLAEIFEDNTIVILENEKFKELRDENRKLIGIDLSPHLFENKYLMLQVDLTQKKQVIEKAFGDIIDKYRKCVVKKTQRNRQYTTDIWSIYDKSAQKNISQIAKEQSGINENPTYDHEVMKQYKRARRAKTQAEKLINEMRKSTPTKTKYIIIPL